MICQWKDRFFSVDKKGYAVPAVEKTIALLEHLGKLRRGMTLSDLSSELGIAKTSVFSILHTLEAHNYVRKTDDGLFHLGLKLYSLGMASLEHIDVKTVFVPLMKQLRDETHFTVHLVAYDQGETVCLEKIDGDGMIRFQSYIGERKAMNTSASGKAIAAYLPEAELKRMFAKGLNRSTPRSIVTEAALREHLERVREQGFAVDDEEGEIGVRCIGTPIFMADNLVFGAISVSTLASSLPESAVASYAAKLSAVCEKLSRELGYRGIYPRP